MKLIHNLLKKKLQIGDCILPENLCHNNLTIIGNNENLTTSFIYADESSNEPIKLLNMRARGNIYFPKELLKNNTPIGEIIYSGHDGYSYDPTSIIRCITTEDYSKYYHGSALEFKTTQNNSTSPTTNMIINHDGTIYCMNTRESLNITNGSLVINGGVGITKNINIGDKLKINDNIFFSGNYEHQFVGSDTKERFDNKRISLCGGGYDSNMRGGFITVSGNDSVIDGSIQMNTGFPNGSFEILTGNTKRFLIDRLGHTIISNTENSISSLTGSLFIHGGVNINKNLYLGGSLIMPNENSIIGTQKLTLQSNDNFIKIQKDNIQINTTDATMSFSNNNKIHTINENGNWHIYSTVEGQKIIANDIQCNKLFQLPVLSEEPETKEIGKMYFDSTRDYIRVYTKLGWRKYWFQINLYILIK